MNNDEMVKTLFRNIEEEITGYYVEAGIINDKENAKKALYNEFHG